MEVICKPVGPVMANCYIVTDHGHALVIDPGDEAGELKALIAALNVKVDAVLLTHAHFDHIGAVDGLVREYGVDVYVNPQELDYLSSPQKNSSASFMGIPHVSQQTHPVAFKEGENQIGTFTVTAYYAPGHSVGSTILEIGDNLFTGDVLFENSIGRTDLPGGSVEQMRDSLNFIKSLTKDYTVYPGHGPSTSLDYEQTHNPYLLYNLL
ncbi:MBL fold metallo-hydrolase [Allobaculum mucilyticum]|uniref:MBL fold metallo-hydrolase n=1 Tax=Allobaculum mucilyticum TaxID=2834459 RepID=UPI001E5C780B|nr:MBL fold metallo-hydrolase [Allobaculum mucilyticum]UNT95969.1 MBL fold metallo-hydrolase [Allobaculum mucilyticum]